MWPTVLPAKRPTSVLLNWVRSRRITGCGHSAEPTHSLLIEIPTLEDALFDGARIYKDLPKKGANAWLGSAGELRTSI
jgi:hypothetical protein